MVHVAKLYITVSDRLTCLIIICQWRIQAVWETNIPRWVPKLWSPKNTFQVFFLQLYFNKKYVEIVITDLRTDCVRECNFRLFGGTNFENFSGWSAPTMVAPFWVRCVYRFTPLPLQKNAGYVTAGMPFNFPCIEISVNLPADSNFRHHQKKSFSSAVRDKQKGRLPSSKNVIRNLYNVEKSASCQITFLMT